MTYQEKHDLVKSFEKAWYQSKKFLAFLLLLALLSAFVFCALYWKFDFGWPVASVLISIVFTMGFATLAFNGKQALLDQYTRGIAFTGKAPTALGEKIKSAIGEGEDTNAEPS